MVTSAPPVRAPAPRPRTAEHDLDDRSERFVRAVTVALWCYPLVWALGLGGLAVPVLGATAALYLLRARTVSRSGLLAAAVAVALVMSVPIGVLSFGVETGRLVSVVGNVSAWVMLAGALTAATRTDAVRRVGAPLLWIAAWQGGLVMLSAAVHPVRLPLPLLEGVAGGWPTGLRAYAVNNLYFQDWLDGPAFRSAGLMGNPTWAGAFGAVCILAAPALWARGVNRVLLGAGLAGAGVSVYFSLSRATYLALGVAALVGLLVWVRRRSTIWFHLALTAAPILGAMVAIVAWRLVAQLVTDVNDGRAGSGQSRAAIYTATVDLVRRLVVPVLGYGVKPQSDDLVASVASHSTYLGIVFRAGIVGALLLAALYWRLVRATVTGGRAVGAAIVTFVVIWCILEDFDAGHLIPLALLLIGPVDEPAPVTRRRPG